jgi:hypothetical protein
VSKRANQKRAMRIKKVLHNYAGEADDLRANITDALTDLRHLCDMEQYLRQLRKAEGGLRGMNTTQASDLAENLA